MTTPSEGIGSPEGPRGAVDESLTDRRHRRSWNGGAPPALHACTRCQRGCERGGRNAG